MPEVGGKKFPYTPEGMLAAKKAKAAMNRKTLKKSTNRDAVTKSNPIKGY